MTVTISRHGRVAPLSVVLIGVILFCACRSTLCQDSVFERKTVGTSTITGTLRDPAGIGISGVVRILLEHVDNGHLVLSLMCVSRSTSGGAYSCADLPGGRYLLVAEARLQPGAGEAAGRSVMSRSLLFYPYSGSLNGAEPFLLASGRNETVDMTVQPRETHTIDGTILTGSLESTISVSMLAADGERITMDSVLQIRNEGGRFSISNVPDGRYLIQAKWFERVANDSVLAGRMGSAIVAVDGSNVSGVKLDDESVVMVVGTVRFEPQSQTKVATVLLEDATKPNIQYHAQLSPEGRFVLRDVPTGRYFIRLGNGKKAFIERLIADGAPVDDQELSLIGGRPHVSLRVEASENVATIRGTVAGADSNASRGEVIAESEASGECYVSETDKRGQFVITGLAPGDYRLYSWPTGREAAYADNGVLERYDGEYEEVTVTEGALVSGVDLKLLDGSW